MLIEGSKIEPKNSTLYVESGIEEYFNSVCNGIEDENWRDTVRFYNQEKFPAFVDEVLTKHPHKHNALFDYENYPDLTAKFGENVPASFKRFQAVINNVGELYNNGEFNPRKTVVVLCTHGISMMVIYNFLFEKELMGNYGYCNINLFEVKKESESDLHYKVDVKIENLIAYDN